jgi:beta-mannosidase
MGTLFWQLNDCWPGSSWSAIDYFGQPKAVFYSLKKLFNTQLVSISEQQDYYKISCLSDSLKDFKVTLNLKILNFKSELIWQKSFSKELNNSHVNHTFISKNELPLFDSTSCYFKAEIVQNQKIMATTNYLFSQPKKTNLKKAEILIKKINSNTFQISANEFIKDLYLYDQNQNANHQ